MHLLVVPGQIIFPLDVSNAICVRGFLLFITKNLLDKFIWLLASCHRNNNFSIEYIYTLAVIQVGSKFTKYYPFCLM